MLSFNSKDMIENENYIGKYLLGQKIGEGQYSIVKKCYDTINNNSYAIKIIQFHSDSNNEMNNEINDKITNEINALNTLKDHSNILTLYDYFYGQNNVYIITNKSQSDLYNFLEHFHSILDVNTSGLIISQIANGLLYMKSKSLSHSDIKPENILIDIHKDNLEVKICDFGSCQLIEPDIVKSYNYSGTFGFHSPEVWLNPESYCPYDSDIFSLGCIALEIILSEIDFLQIWLPVYEVRDDFSLFKLRIREAISTVRNLIKISLTLPTNENNFQIERTGGSSSSGGGGNCNKNNIRNYELHPSIELIQKMIDYHPRRRPTLDQILSSDFCWNVSHKEAIHNLIVGEKKWNRSSIIIEQAQNLQYSYPNLITKNINDDNNQEYQEKERVNSAYEILPTSNIENNSQPINIKNQSTNKLKSLFSISSFTSCCSNSIIQTENNYELPILSSQSSSSSKNQLSKFNNKSMKKSKSFDRHSTLFPSFNNNNNFYNNNSSNRLLIQTIFDESKSNDQQGINDNFNNKMRKNISNKFSIHTNSLPIKLSLTNNSINRMTFQSPYNSPSSSPKLSSSCSSSSINLITLDPLFQSPISQSISKWTEVQHFKCQTSLHRLVNFQSDC